MQRQAVAAAALAAALAAFSSSPTLAQTNVNLYGIADAGVSYDDTGVADQSAFRVNSGYMSSSRFGVSGSEGLGGGLRAVFTLEAGFQIDTGAFSNTATGTPGFSRRAFVGLASDRWGSLTLGRDYTPIYWTVSTADTLRFGLYGNMNNTQFMTGSSNQFIPADNALFYATPKIAGGLTLRAMASAGGEGFGATSIAVAPRTTGRMAGVGAEWSSGPLLLTAAFQTRVEPNADNTDRDNRRDWAVGGRYDFGAFSVSGGYIDVDRAFTALDGSQWWAGGSVKLGAGTLLAQFAQMRFDAAAGGDPRSNTIAVAYTYPFSRRTTGYLSYGQVSNNATANLGLFAADNNVSPGTAISARGADPRGIAIGVRHTF